MINEGVCERCDNWSESEGCKKNIYYRCLDRLGVVNGIHGFDTKDRRPEVQVGALGCGWYVDWAGERVWFYPGLKNSPTEIRIGSKLVRNGVIKNDPGL